MDSVKDHMKQSSKDKTIKQLNTQITKLKAIAGVYQNRIAEKELGMKQMKKQIEKLKVVSSEYNAAAENYRKDLAEKELAVNQLSEQVTNLKAVTGKYSVAAADYKNDLDDKKVEINQLNTQIVKLKETAVDQQKSLNDKDMIIRRSKSLVESLENMPSEHDDETMQKDLVHVLLIIFLAIIAFFPPVKEGFVNLPFLKPTDDSIVKSHDRRILKVEYDENNKIIVQGAIYDDLKSFRSEISQLAEGYTCIEFHGSGEARYEGVLETLRDLKSTQLPVRCMYEEGEEL